MALVIPLASSAGVIENILFKVRKGIAMSRNASQANPITGVMVDLPDRIDFEMTLLKTYQSSSYQRVTDSSGSEGGKDSKFTKSGETALTSKSSVDGDTSVSAVSGSGTGSESTSRNGTGNETSLSGSTEGSLGIDLQSTAEKSLGKGSGNGKEIGKGNAFANSKESEGRCTYQDHVAYRLYDKFDTDTGLIQGISL